MFAALEDGETGIVIVDARAPRAYEREHIPGAINLPHRQMNRATTASFSKDKVYIVYCDGIGCNGSTKGAANLSALGFRVKELMGGIVWWKQDGFAVHSSGACVAALSKDHTIDCACN